MEQIKEIEKLSEKQEPTYDSLMREMISVGLLPRNYALIPYRRCIEEDSSI